MKDIGTRKLDGKQQKIVFTVMVSLPRDVANPPIIIAASAKEYRYARKYAD